MDRVNAVTQECFGAVMQVRKAAPGTLPAAEVLHERMRSFVDGMMRRSRELGFSPEDTQDIAYAVVALIDETMLTVDDAVSAFWMGNLLQFHFFQETLAGEGFFTRLEAVRKESRRNEVLRVYALCLLFGFQGRYRVRNGQLELMQVTESVQHELVRGLGDSETLSPQGERTEERLQSQKQRRTALVVAAGVLGFAVLVYGGLWVTLRQSAASTAAEISAWDRK